MVFGEQAQSILGLGMESPFLLIKLVFREKIKVNPNHYHPEIHTTPASQGVFIYRGFLKHL